MTIRTTPYEITVNDYAAEGFESHVIEVIDITRSQYLQLVADVIDSRETDAATHKQVQDILMPVARTMKRFPLGAWIAGRGCGCLVGEALVASHVFDDHNRLNELVEARYEARADHYGPAPARSNLQRALREYVDIQDILRAAHGREAARVLEDVGCQMDHAIRLYVSAYALVGSHSIVDAVVIVDDDATAAA